MVKASSGLLWRCWGEECLVYSDLTGATHLLSPCAAQLLKSLELQSQTVCQLQNFVLDFFGDSRIEEASAWLDESLRQLQRLGLVDMSQS